MRVDDGLEVGRFHGQQHAITCDAGVVDDHAERSELGLHAVDHGVDRRFVADIAHNNHGPATHLTQLFGKRLTVLLPRKVVDGHVGAGRRQHGRDLTAYAAAGARYQGHRAGKIDANAHERFPPVLNIGSCEPAPVKALYTLTIACSSHRHGRRDTTD